MDVYSYNPDELPIDEFVHGTRKEAFFFTKIRSNSTRSSSKGFWKACDEEKQIVHNNEIIGYKKILVFFWENRQKSDYGMQEYSLSSDDFNLANNIEHLVLCRVEIKNRTSTLTEEGLVPPESAVEHSDTNMNEETRTYNLQMTTPSSQGSS
ncbi:hypothetical protein IFM89_039737 [Coptis chinensis]|uniref:NAC domain-containing protein n=1 Tax=Coptis chinensis TaxID=261450 RepID=A0A835LH14_9MAGN|nr:hypothetical protein IFM89_039737 [Coptis chinensis]